MVGLGPSGTGGPVSASATRGISHPTPEMRRRCRMVQRCVTLAAEAVAAMAVADDLPTTTDG